MRYDLVIDRLAWWYFVPREWLKKAALVNDTYMLNNPFTFQAMEKHSAYCAMIRLGFDIPPTVLVPYKNPLEHEKWAYTAGTYNLPFELDEVRRARRLPHVHEAVRRGRLARSVSRVDDVGDPAQGLRPSPDRCSCRCRPRSPRYDAFARSLSSGPETKIMKFRPEPADARPVRGVARLPAGRGGLGDPHALPDDQRVLPLGVQLLRGVGHRQRCQADRLRECLPGHRDHLAALLLPVGPSRN